MTDPIRRSVRGLFQGGIAETIVQFIEAFFSELNEAQHVALLAVLTLVVSFVQNYLEDNTAVPALLKAPASEGVNPIPDPEGGHGTHEIVLVIATVWIAVIFTVWAFRSGPFS